MGFADPRLLLPGRPAERAPAEAEPEPAPAAPIMLLAWQRTAGNQAVGRMLQPADAFAHATSGRASAIPHREKMEAAFGTSFAGVTAHLGGPEAEIGLSQLGAHAATHGERVAFGRSDPDEALVAHELAHVVQQRQGAGGGRTATGISDAGEAHADAAAEAVVAGRAIPDVGTAGDVIQRAAVTTNGGTFDTTAYSAISAPTGAVGEGLGANIVLEFKANDLVESTKIGLIQSVKAMKSSVPAGARDTVATGVGDPEEGQLIMGPAGVDPGREIDRAVHPGGRAMPNTSPIYGVHNAPGAGGTAAALGDRTPTTGTSQWGSHTKGPLGIFLPPVPAIIDDTPGRGIEFAGQTYEHTFEATAIAIEGPIPPNTYLGSVSWGWRSDAAGAVTVDPLTLVRAGAPSAEFMGAAANWNAATFHDTGDGTAYSSVDIPTTTLDSGSVAAPDMSTVDILNRIAIVATQLTALAAGTDRTNKEFEQRALEAELGRRRVKVSVSVRTTEDWGEDEVYVKLVGAGGRKVVSANHDMDNGDSHDFLVPIGALLPLTGSIGVEVYDEDWPDGNDELVAMTFAAPWGAARNSTTMDDADYDVTVTFER